MSSQVLNTAALSMTAVNCALPAPTERQCDREDSYPAAPDQTMDLGVGELLCAEGHDSHRGRERDHDQAGHSSQTDTNERLRRFEVVDWDREVVQEGSPDNAEVDRKADGCRNQLGDDRLHVPVARIGGRAADQNGAQ